MVGGAVGVGVTTPFDSGGVVAELLAETFSTGLDRGEAAGDSLGGDPAFDGYTLYCENKLINMPAFVKGGSHFIF